MKSRYYMGIDIGSVSLNIAVIDEKGHLLLNIYDRTNGQPFNTLLKAFEKIEETYSSFAGAAVTGSGKDFLAKILNINKENEIITQARATAFFHPEVKTAIEIGGQDSKIMFFDQDKSPDKSSNKTILVDHALNEVCAAGTGSFLDQQALRLGISIDKEFSVLALKSKKPSTIAGRCSVFAKSDMTHLQQDGEPLENIISGLCFALARNYLSNLVRGREVKKPVVFQGGVAANKGVAAAFESLLNLKKNELIIPEHFKIMGAIGAALKTVSEKETISFDIKKAQEKLNHYFIEKPFNRQSAHLKKLLNKNNFYAAKKIKTTPLSDKNKNYFAGIDIGASSINIIIIDEDKQHIDSLYMLKQGSVIESLQNVFSAFNQKGNQKIKDEINIKSVGITGSGRYFIGELINADVIVNEITAQAAAAIDINPDVDTVFEIGGQDSKYISIKNGAVTHFEMNKVCAAGTGSFLQEQAGRLDVKINDEFSNSAFLSARPANLGTKCTVFMESDLIHHQQTGACKEDLMAGLSYSIVNNFLEKVVGNNDIGENIFFQGGVAGNQSVTAAFENILEKPIHVLKEHGLTGAYGAAIIALKRFNKTGSNTGFKGFDINNHSYETNSFVCKECPNHCEIKKITINSERVVFSGGICERYENADLVDNTDNQEHNKGPYYTKTQLDLFDYRKKILQDLLGKKNRIDKKDQLDKKNQINKETFVKDQRPVIGIPKVLMFHELLPLWLTFFSLLDVKIILTGKSTTKIIHQGLEKVLSETCYPVKLAYGHIIDLIEKEVNYLFLPVIIDLENSHKDANRSYNCPYVQGVPSMLVAAFASKTDAKFLTPSIFMDDLYRNLEKEMLKIGQKFCSSELQINNAIKKAKDVQNSFEFTRYREGEKFLKNLDSEEKALVILGKPYNLYDPALNLNISEKLKKLGIKAIPYDFINLDSIELPAHFSNLVWKNEQTLIRSIIYAKNQKNLFPVIITNYGCGPDAFSFNYIKDIMQNSPYLILEVDEHSGDAGLVTRIEAFWDTLDNFKISGTGINSEIADISVTASSMTNVKTASLINSYGFYKPSKQCEAFKKNIYIFNGSDHSDIWHAAAVASGLTATQLPMPDEQSQELGKNFTTSRECHPYILLTGDMVKAANMKGFDPDSSAFLMLNYDGSCRMTQYGISHKLVLKQLGISQVPVIAPVASHHKDDLTKLFGMKFSLNLWRGWIASDFLMKKLLHTRPYELREGEAQEAYDFAVQDIVSGIINNEFSKALHKAAQKMSEIKVKRVPKPVVGIVGEFYSCINTWANNDIVNIMESLGVEVRLGTSPADYLIYFNESYPGLRFKEKKYIRSLYYYIRKTFLMHEKQKIEKIFGNSFYKSFHTPLSKQRNQFTAPYIDPVVDPILSINIAKAKEYALDNCNGIANLIVLNCLYGNVTSAIYRTLQKEHNAIPVLTITYDGLKATNEKTRIEAFIHQVKNHHRNQSI